MSSASTGSEEVYEYSASSEDLSRVEMREHLSRIRVNDVAAQAAEIHKLGMSVSKWISLALLVIRIALNIGAVLSNFKNQVIDRDDVRGERESDWIDTSRNISVWAELLILAFLGFLFLVVVIDMVYSLVKLAAQERKRDPDDAGAHLMLGGVEVARGNQVIPDNTDWKDRAGEAAKFVAQFILGLASFSLLQFMPSMQKLKDLPGKARSIVRYVTKKLSSGQSANPLQRQRRWSELSFCEALALFIGFGILQTFLFVLGIAALFVKLSQLRFVVETDLIDWGLAELVTFIGFLNNVASISDLPAERAAGALRVIFAGTDGRLDNFEWRSMETFRSFFAYRVLITHNLFMAIAILTQLSARDLQTVLIAEKEVEPVDEVAVRKLHAFESEARVNVFGAAKAGGGLFNRNFAANTDSESYTDCTYDDGDDDDDDDEYDGDDGDDDVDDAEDDDDDESGNVFSKRTTKANSGSKQRRKDRK